MFLPLLFNNLIIAAWIKLKRQLKLVISFIHKTEVMNKEKASFVFQFPKLYVYRRILKYILYVFICFSFDSYTSLLVTFTRLLLSLSARSGC